MLATRPLHDRFGVEIRGADILNMTDAAYREIRAAFEAHSLVVLPGQSISDDAQLAFSRLFGPLEITKKGTMGTGTEIVRLSNILPDGRLVQKAHKEILTGKANQLWHTDSAFKPVPALASLLSARVVPPSGGETEFASMAAAWEDLPQATRNALDGRIGRHWYGHSRRKIDPKMVSADEKAQLPPVRQVTVRVNPVTGAKAPYVCSHTYAIEGMPEDEALSLIDEVVSFATRPGMTYAHPWQEGDLVIWDNRMTLHRGRPFDSARHGRTIVRTTVAGDGPTVTPSYVHDVEPDGLPADAVA